MKRIIFAAALVCFFSIRTLAQAPEMKIVMDTLIVQADGTYEADPDLATLTFDINSLDKDMKTAYANATQSMQRIVALANSQGLKKDEIQSGVLTLQPSFDRDRKNRPKSYTVQGQMTLKVHDFSLIGPLLDGAVQEGIVDFRSLTYSLRDEEAAKQKAVAQAMRRAVDRATTALAQSGQSAGPVRYVSLDVTEPFRVATVQPTQSIEVMAEISPGAGGGSMERYHGPPAPPPPPEPEKIAVTARVQCAIQIK